MLCGSTESEPHQTKCQVDERATKNCTQWFRTTSFCCNPSNLAVLVVWEQRARMCHSVGQITLRKRRSAWVDHDKYVEKQVCSNKDIRSPHLLPSLQRWDDTKARFGQHWGLAGTVQHWTKDPKIPCSLCPAPVPTLMGEGINTQTQSDYFDLIDHLSHVYHYSMVTVTNV